jgi:hypothetical protein
MHTHSDQKRPFHGTIEAVSTQQGLVMSLGTIITAHLFKNHEHFRPSIPPRVVLIFLRSVLIFHARAVVGQ